MTRKINIFTVLIFAYSIIVCATFKKEDSSNDVATRTQNVNSKVANKLKSEYIPAPIVAIDK